MRRIAWITFADITATPDGMHSDTASARYRMLLPIAHMDKTRWHIDVVALPRGKTATEPVRQAVDAADVVIFSKSFDTANEELTRRAQARGGKVVFDICDHFFGHAEFGAHYEAMARMADRVVCNTPVMAEMARPYAAQGSVVIEDPVEGERRPPRFAPEQRLKLLWFGHPSNLDSFNDAFPAVLRAAQKVPMALTLLTQASQELITYCAQADAVTQGALRMECVQWSLDTQQRALEEADAIIIPTSAQDEKRVKSANRMIEALQAGRAVVAGPLPAYMPFAEWAVIEADMERGLARLMEMRNELPGLIAQAQDFIDERYAPAVIARQWEAMVEEL